MVEKFNDFDQYQLGKHGKKVKNEKIPLESMVLKEALIDDPDNPDYLMMDEETPFDLAQKRFSVKRLIRLLHIKEPIFHVMAILGKK